MLQTHSKHILLEQDTIELHIWSCLQLRPSEGKQKQQPQQFQTLETRSRVIWGSAVIGMVVCESARIEDVTDWSGAARCSLGRVCSVNGEDWRERGGEGRASSGQATSPETQGIKANLACVRKNNLLWFTIW